MLRLNYKLVEHPKKRDDFAEKLDGEVIIADKGYVSKEFAEEMEKRIHSY